MDLTHFETQLLLSELGKKTTLNYVNQMKGFFLHHSEFTEEEVDKYLFSKLDKWSAGSRNMFLMACKKYMEINNINFKLKALGKVKKGERRAYIKEDNMDEILDKMPILFEDAQKAKCVLSLLFYTGMRPKELYTLKRENIDLKERTISLNHTKTHLSRIVFIEKELVKDIELFFNREPERNNAFNLNESTIANYCRRISENFNIKLTPYMLRHSYAHKYLENSNNHLMGLKRMLGHTNVSTTQIYSEVDDKELKEIYDKAFKNKRRKIL